MDGFCQSQSQLSGRPLICANKEFVHWFENRLTISGHCCHRRRRTQPLLSSSVAVDMPFQVSLVAWQERPQPRGDLAVGAAAAAQLLRTPTAAPAACIIANRQLSWGSLTIRQRRLAKHAQIKAVAVDVGAVAMPQLHHLWSARVAACNPPPMLFLFFRRPECRRWQRKPTIEDEEIPHPPRWPLRLEIVRHSSLQCIQIPKPLLPAITMHYMACCN